MSTTNALSSTTNIALMVSQYKQSLSTQSVTPLRTRRSTLQNRQSILTQMQSLLKTLSQNATGLAGTSYSSQFKAFSASSTQPAVVDASTDSTASVGTHTISVSQLAKADTLVSSRFTTSGTSIASAELSETEKTAGQGTRQFNLVVNGVSKASLSVTFGASDTNATVLSNIAAAINGSTDANGLVSASVISISSTESRLVLTSKATGAANAVALQNGTGTLMDSVGLPSSVTTARTAPSPSTTVDDPANSPGGYLYPSADQLDAKFTVDGIAIRRPTNSVTDVIPGVSLSLKGVQQQSDTPVNISVGVDSATIQSRVQQFITAYNAALDYLNKQTAIDTTSNTRQVLAGDSTFLSMRYSLRSLMFQPVTAVSSGAPHLLADVGITAGADGTLSISDTGAFNTALANDPAKVSNLFSSSDGAAVRMQSYLRSVVNPGGMMDSAQQGVVTQLKTLQSQIDRANSQITAKGNTFQGQLTQLQSVYLQASNQQYMINQILGIASSVTG